MNHPTSQGSSNSMFDIENVFVFARFETVGGNDRLPSDYSLRYLRSVSQSEINPEASWIEGVLQTAAGRQQLSQHLPGSVLPSITTSTEPYNSATFVLNGQSFAKWYYHWESGANKVQRATKHALKAYVFYHAPTQESHQPMPDQSEDLQAFQGGQQQGSESAIQGTSSSDGELKLLCVVTSPSFTVVSYRRAPLDMSPALIGHRTPLDIGGVDRTTLVPHYAIDSARPVDSALRRLVQHQISQAFQEYNQQQRHQQDARSPSGESLRAALPVEERKENNAESSKRDPFDRYRRLEDREGLSFRLMTPEDAAMSGSSLHGQMLPREPRLVFDRATRRPSIRHWRVENDEFDEGYDEAASIPQQWAIQTGAPNAYETKAARPFRTSQTTRQVEAPSNATISQYKQLQCPLDYQQRELHQLTDLAIVHFFASHVALGSVDRAANLETAMAITIAQHWRFNADGAKRLAEMLLTVGKDRNNDNPHRSVARVKREEVMLALGEVCIWALSTENLGLIQSLLSTCNPLLLDRPKSGGAGGSDDEGQELRAAFLDCVARCWGALDRFLQSPRASRSTICSMRALSDAVVGVVYSDLEFENLRSKLRSVLQRPAVILEDSKTDSTTTQGSLRLVSPRCNLVGWKGFVAQVREGYLRDQYAGRGQPWSPIQSANARPSRWTADWVLQPSSLSVSHYSASQRRSDSTLDAQGDDSMQGSARFQGNGLPGVPSMWISCLALSQLLRLKLATAGDPLHTLYVQADPSVLSQGNAWLRLVCDGRVRVAPVAPNGLTSLMGGASCGFGGDYMAYQPEQEMSTSGPIRLEFYWWPYTGAERTLVAFRSAITVNISANGRYLEGQIDLERGIVKREVFAAAQTPDMELWTPTQRVQSVSHWSPWLSIQGLYARK